MSFFENFPSLKSYKGKAEEKYRNIYGTTVFDKMFGYFSL